MPIKDTPANRADPFAPRFWEARVDQPLRWRETRRIFVNSMSDVFHAHFSLDLIQRVFDVMNRAHWHQFQVLTKRPERALRLSDRLSWTENIWMGTSIEDMEAAQRADHLRQIPAAVRFISAEPLLGPVDELNLDGIEWVIGGGESGLGHRPCDPAWARSLRDLCASRGVAFFWTQWGGRTATGSNPNCAVLVPRNAWSPNGATFQIACFIRSQPSKCFVPKKIAYTRRPPWYSSKCRTWFAPACLS